MTRAEFEKMWRKSMEERWRNALCTVDDPRGRLNTKEFIETSLTELLDTAWRHYCFARDAAAMGGSVAC